MITYKYTFGNCHDSFLPLLIEIREVHKRILLQYQIYKN